jgi:hypothetical protein
MIKPKRIPNPPRKCMFCGKGGISKEHIWARWMTQYLPKDAPNFSMLDVVVHKTHETKKARRENRSAYSGTIKLVCKPCNNGWMSRLQNDAKPILLPLMRGERRALNRREQVTLAAWIAMFIMVAEFQTPSKVTIPQAVRERFKDTLQPPDLWAIWLGIYTRQKWHGIVVHSSIAVTDHDGSHTLNPDGSARPNTHAVTVVIGKLYIHAMGSVFPEFARKQRLDKARFPMARLWPRGIRPFKWAAIDLSDRQASGIATALIDYYRRNIRSAESL